MKNFKALLGLVALSIVLVGCASGPKYSEVRSTFVQPPQSEGRIFFYRTSSLGAAIQPAVKLNGERVGKAQAKGFFYVDRPAGTYAVETSTEVKRSLNIDLAEGEIKYIRLNMSMGLFAGHVTPELVANAVGEEEIAKCKYMHAE